MSDVIAGIIVSLLVSILILLVYAAGVFTGSGACS